MCKIAVIALTCFHFSSAFVQWSHSSRAIARFDVPPSNIEHTCLYTTNENTIDGFDVEGPDVSVRFPKTIEAWDGPTQQKSVAEVLSQPSAGDLEVYDDYGVPVYRECGRYFFKQFENYFDMVVPLPRAYPPDDIFVRMSKDVFEFAIGTDTTGYFGAITGVFYRDISADTSYWRVMRHGDYYYVHLRIEKIAKEGFYELWPGLLVQEQTERVMRLEGGSWRYSWHQDEESVHVSFPIPPDTTKRDINIDFTSRKISVSFDTHPSFGKLKGQFYSSVVADDSYWVIDGEGDSRHVTLFLVKQRGALDRVVWWTSLMEGGDETALGGMGEEGGVLVAGGAEDGTFSAAISSNSGTSSGSNNGEGYVELREEELFKRGIEGKIVDIDYDYEDVDVDADVGASIRSGGTGGSRAGGGGMYDGRVIDLQEIEDWKRIQQ